MEGRDASAKTMNDIRVTSWNELNDKIYQGAWQPSMGRFRSDFAYRGMVDAQQDLRTSLMRLGGELERQEHHLLRNFRKYARRDSVPETPSGTGWRWAAPRPADPPAGFHVLSLRRHAFRDAAGGCIRDGWGDLVHRLQEAHALLPERLGQQLRSDLADVFTTDGLAEAASTLQELDGLGSQQEFAVFMEPPSLDERIVNQAALFAMMSSPWRGWISGWKPGRIYAIGW